MPDTRNTSTSAPANTAQQQPSENRSQMQRRNTQTNAGLASSHDYFDRMAEEMDRAFDRMFGNFGFGAPQRSWLARAPRSFSGAQTVWTPRVEAFQKGDRYIVRAELPGLKKEDVHVEVGDDAVTIQGERREEQHEEKEGWYHSERQYGSFYRTIPLPEGVIAESCEAKFNNGVLEIEMKAPPAETKARRKIDIK